MAEKLKLRCPITILNFETAVSTDFKVSRKGHHNMFNAAEKLEAIEEFFETQIDFDELKESGVIEDHFHLHKRLAIDEIQVSFGKYARKLCCRMACGSYLKYAQPLNMVKNYYGEKVAFEYAFLLHYQSWLIYASIAGVALTIYQWSKWFRFDYDLSKALDTEFNVLLGVFMALWATLFVESWKRKQEYLRYLWCVDDRDYTDADEREDFRSYKIYNEATDSVERAGVKIARWKECAFFSATALITLASVTCMIVYYVMQTNMLFEEKDGKQVVVEGAASKPGYYILTVVYSCLIVGLGFAQKTIAHAWTYQENPRYQKKYEDRLTKRLFQFNVFIYYGPLAYQAFNYENPRRYDDLYFQMLTQMLVKQLAYNVLEYVWPLVYYRPALVKIRHEYWGVRASYMDDAQLRHYAEKEGEKMIRSSYGPSRQQQETVKIKPVNTDNLIIPGGMPKLNKVKDGKGRKERHGSHSSSSSSDSSSDCEAGPDAAAQRWKNLSKGKRTKKVQHEARRMLMRSIRGTGDEERTIRKYQAFRDLGLAKDPPAVLDAYMELVLQFGFVAIFSSVMPLAPVFSLLCNHVQLSSQIDNLVYNRRGKAEPAKGIGAWMNSLEIIT